MDNRRRWARVARELRVLIHFDSVRSAASAMTVDIGRGGIFVAMNPPSPVGTPVRCSITVGAPQKVLDIDGVVVRAGAGGRPPHFRFGIGVAIGRPPPGWDEFCEELERQTDPDLPA